MASTSHQVREAFSQVPGNQVKRDALLVWSALADPPEARSQNLKKRRHVSLDISTEIHQKGDKSPKRYSVTKVTHCIR